MRSLLALMLALLYVGLPLGVGMLVWTVTASPWGLVGGYFAAQLVMSAVNAGHEV